MVRTWTLVLNLTGLGEDLPVIAVTDLASHVDCLTAYLLFKQFDLVHSGACFLVLTVTGGV